MYLSLGWFKFIYSIVQKFVHSYYEPFNEIFSISFLLDKFTFVKTETHTETT